MYVIGLLLIIVTLAVIYVVANRQDKMIPATTPAEIADGVVSADREREIISGRVKYVSRNGERLSATIVGYRGDGLKYALRRRGHRNGAEFWRSASVVSI